MFSSPIAATMLGFLPGRITPTRVRDTFLSQFQQKSMNFRHVDRGSSATVASSLDMAAVPSNSGDSVEFGFVTVVRTTTEGATEFQFFMAPLAVFAQGLTSAQTAITVGGTPVFAGRQPAALQHELNEYAHAQASTAAAPTGVA